MSDRLNMSATVLLRVEAAIEGITGIALIVVPGIVAWLLFGVELPAIATVVARVAGVALLALSFGCWVAGRGSGAVPVSPEFGGYRIDETGTAAAGAGASRSSF